MSIKLKAIKDNLYYVNFVYLHRTRDFQVT